MLLFYWPCYLAWAIQVDVVNPLRSLHAAGISAGPELAALAAWLAPHPALTTIM